MKLGFAIPHEIRIKPSANMGFIIKIGCGEFVAKNQGDLFDGLKDYVSDPIHWENEYNKLPSREVATDSENRPEPLRPIREAIDMKT